MANLEIFDLAILLFGAKMGGIIFDKLRQPSLAGELLSGIILGPSILGIAKSSTLVDAMSQIGLMFLVLLTTLAIDWKKIENKVETYSFVQIFMSAIVFAVIFLVGNLLKWNFYSTVIISVAVMQSSLAIASRTLTNIGALNTTEGEEIIGFQVVNDVAAILSIAVVANFLNTRTLQLEDIAKLLFIVIGFFVFMSKTGARFVSWLTNMVQKYGLDEAMLGLTLVLTFLLATFTEQLGIQSFLGVFLAGILLSKTPQVNIISTKVKDVGEAFFIPIFFASIGLSANVIGLYQELFFILALVGLIVILKLVSSSTPFIFFNYSGKQALRIGSGMISLSEMSLIILSIGLTSKALDVSLYSTMIITFLLVDVLSPMITSMTFRDERPSNYGRGYSKINTIIKKIKR